MPTLSHGRVASTALATCLALGLGTASVAAAAPNPEAASSARNGSDVRPSRQAKKKAKKQQSVRSTPRAGGTVLSGSKAPGARLGSNGDLYLRTSDDTLYGPKTRRGWGRPRSLVGPQGPQGLQGAQGAPGATGPQGPASTPPFANGVVTTIAAPGTVSGTFQDNGTIFSPYVEVGSVTVPAGVALVQLRVRITPGDGFNPASTIVMCEVGNDTTFAVGQQVSTGQLAADAIGWTALAQPTTLSFRCAMSGWDGTPGATATATVAGSQAVVFAANVPAA